MNLDQRINEPWLLEAACVGKDTKIFFPGRGRVAVEAKRICGGCTMRAECLEYALENNIQGGIFGGVSERARRVMRKERRLKLRLEQEINVGNE